MATRTRAPAFVMVVPSRTEFLVVVRDVVRGLAELAGFEGTTAENLGLAVDECATNVIKHAYHGRDDRSVQVRVEYRGADFVVEVLDDGDPLDPASVPRVDLERYAHERRTGGLGVHLMGRLMDSVRFERTSGSNVCCMVKHRGGEPDADAGDAG